MLEYSLLTDAADENKALLSFVLTNGSYVRIRTGDPEHLTLSAKRFES